MSRNMVTEYTPNEVRSLDELRRAVDTFFGFSCKGYETHVRVPWEAWDTLATARRNLMASLYAERAAAEPEAKACARCNDVHSVLVEAPEMGTLKTRSIPCPDCQRWR